MYIEGLINNNLFLLLICVSPVFVCLDLLFHLSMKKIVNNTKINANNNL